MLWQFCICMYQQKVKMKTLKIIQSHKQNNIHNRMPQKWSLNCVKKVKYKSKANEIKLLCH